MSCSTFADRLSTRSCRLPQSDQRRFLIAFRKPPAPLVRPDKAPPSYKLAAQASGSVLAIGRVPTTHSLALLRFELVWLPLCLLLGGFLKPPALPVVHDCSTPSAPHQQTYPFVASCGLSHSSTRSFPALGSVTMQNQYSESVFMTSRNWIRSTGLVTYELALCS